MASKIKIQTSEPKVTLAELSAAHRDLNVSYNALIARTNKLEKQNLAYRDTLRSLDTQVTYLQSFGTFSEDKGFKFLNMFYFLVKHKEQIAAIITAIINIIKESKNA